MKKLFEFFRILIRADTLESSKSFGLLCSILTGSLLCICICFCLVWDVCINGYIKTDLSDLGILIGCIGVYMAGGSLSKTFSEISSKKNLKNGKRENKDTRI